MYKKKLTAEEILHEIKLRMNYDSSKTLNENKIIVEQNDVSSDARIVRDEIESYFNADEQKIVDTIKKYKTKIEFENFLKKYTEISGSDLGQDLTKVLQPTQDAKEERDLKNHLAQLGIDMKRETTPDGKSKFIIGVTAGKEPQKPIQTPRELVNTDGIKKFQDWLDGNHPGWATGYKDGILKQGQNGGGYGKFGPRTQKAWNNEQWRQEYLSGKSQPTSNPTVPPKPVDDGSTSVEGDDANNVLNQ